jgi:hypothetical protein
VVLNFTNTNFILQCQGDEVNTNELGNILI